MEGVMAKPKRRKRLPKTTGEWEALSSDEVARKVFGKRGQTALKREAGQASKVHRRNGLSS